MQDKEIIALAEYDSSSLLKPLSICTAYLTRCSNPLDDGPPCNYTYDSPGDYLHAPDECPGCHQPRQRCRASVYHLSSKEQGTPNYCYSHFNISRDPVLALILNIIDSSLLEVFNEMEIYYKESTAVAPDLTREISVARSLLYEGLSERKDAKGGLELIKDFLSITKQHKDIMGEAAYWEAQTKARLEQFRVNLRIREQAMFLFHLSELFRPTTRPFEHIVEFMQLREPGVWHQVLITYEKIRALDQQQKDTAAAEENSIEGHVISRSKT